MILLLAGTLEARQIAWGLVDQGLPVEASMAGATRKPERLPLPTRIGGFGGEDGFRAYLAEKGVTKVLDATHPFAAQITDRTARVCADLALPYCQLLRPGWVPEKEDDWTFVDAPDAVAQHIPQHATVFLATGRQTLAQFKGLRGRRVLARIVDPPTAPFPFEGGEYVIARPPFPLDREVDLFTQLGVTHLVAKNAGGPAGVAKLTAARQLGLPVIMINRPAMPAATRVSTVQQALDWIKTA
ncbi:MAG: cobalt-precorrin-6A reductase [Pseudomonadota bacterium]